MDTLDLQALELVHAAVDAARAGETDTLAGLLDRGVPLELRSPRGDGLLMIASYNGHEATTRLLLSRGADANALNDRGQTPLAGVVFKGDKALINALIEGGAAVDGCGPDGRTPLMMAAMFDRVDLIDLLVSHGANPAAKDVGGTDAATIAKSMGAANAAARLA